MIELKVIQKEYERLLNNNDLIEMFPNMIGIWEEDREEFTSNYIETQTLFSSIDVTDDFEEDEDDYDEYEY